jgi:hypothetical protein
MTLMIKHDLVTIQTRFLPANGVLEGCVLGNRHQGTFETRKAWRTKTQLEHVDNDLYGYVP